MVPPSVGLGFPQVPLLRNVSSIYPVEVANQKERVLPVKAEMEDDVKQMCRIAKIIEKFYPTSNFYLQVPTKKGN